MAFILLCLGVVVTVLLVRPYKKRYALYNKFDGVMIILVIVFITCILETIIITDIRQITGSVGMIAAGVVAIAPLVYFTVKALQLLKHVLRNNICPCHILCDCNRMQRGDYEDLSATETPINTIN